MKGDSRWVTTLHYAFQDEEYLVRVLGKVGGCCQGTKKALGGQRCWVQGEGDPSYQDLEASTGPQPLGLESLPGLRLGASFPRAACWEMALPLQSPSGPRGGGWKAAPWPPL